MDCEDSSKRSSSSLHDKGKDMFSWSCNHYWLLAAVALLLGCLGIVAVCLIRRWGHELPFEYGVVIDAGSRHSGTFVYKWPSRKDDGTAVVTEMMYRHIVPGISNYTSIPEEAGHSLEEALKEAEKIVPKDEQDKTPLSLGATAGMRMIRASNDSTCNRILSDVRDTLAMTPFKFVEPHKNARIITGLEEASYAWVSVNYLGKKFGVVTATKMLLSYVAGPDNNRPETLGSLDIGGGSTQIAFEPRELDTIPEQTKKLFSLYGHKYTVYGHSYLCYGILGAHRKLLTQLVMDQAPNTTITNPCGAKGRTISETHSEFLQDPCTDNASREYISSRHESTTYHFKGSSDPRGCSRVVAKLFNVSAPCHTGRCTFDGVFQPPLNGQFVAISNFYRTAKFFRVHKKGSTLKEFRENRDAYCKKSWDEIQNIQRGKKEYIPIRCFLGYLIDRLLSIYGFNDSNWDTLTFQKKVNGTKIDWSLGYILTESKMIPAVLVTAPPSLTIYCVLCTLLCLCFIVSVGLACYARRVSQKQNDYETLSTYGSL